MWLCFFLVNSFREDSERSVLWPNFSINNNNKGLQRPKCPKRLAHVLNPEPREVAAAVPMCQTQKLGRREVKLLVCHDAVVTPMAMTTTRFDISLLGPRSWSKCFSVLMLSRLHPVLRMRNEAGTVVPTLRVRTLRHRDDVSLANGPSSDLTGLWLRSPCSHSSHLDAQGHAAGSDPPGLSAVPRPASLYCLLDQKRPWACPLREAEGSPLFSAIIS